MDSPRVGTVGGSATGSQGRGTPTPKVLHNMIRAMGRAIRSRYRISKPTRPLPRQDRRATVELGFKSQLDPPEIGPGYDQFVIRGNSANYCLD